MSDSKCADAAYQGAPGAFSEDAARALLGARARLQPCRTLAGVFRALQERRVASAVVPITNSLAGAVPGTVELMARHQVQVLAAHCQPIEQVLIAPWGATLPALRRIWSHPVALAQCTQFLSRHSHVVPSPAFDTAGAVAQIVARGDVSQAAIGSRRAAAIYGGVVLAEAVQDAADNVTHFVLIRLVQSRNSGT